MKTAKFKIDGVGEFEVVAENTVQMDDKIDLLLQIQFGQELVSIQQHLAKLRKSIVDRLMRENFPDRKAESLIEEEIKQLDQLFREDKSTEKAVYNNLLYSYTRSRFYVEFPVICVKQPDGFDITGITDESLFDKIFTETYKVREEAGSKKKA